MNGPRKTAVIAALCMCFTAVWVLRPRPAREIHAPGLALNVRAFEAMAQKDEALVLGDHAEHMLAQILKDQGKAEIAGDVSEQGPKDRAHQRRAALARLNEGEKVEKIHHVCRWASQKFFELSENKFQIGSALVGRFVDSLSTYELIDAKGHYRSSIHKWVARTLFKARCLSLFERGFTDGFETFEREAYDGWMALHGNSAPIGMRLEALHRLLAARNAATSPTLLLAARGGLLFEAQQYLTATDAWQSAYQKSGWLWLRNQAYLSVLRAQYSSDSP